MTELQPFCVGKTIEPFLKQLVFLIPIKRQGAKIVRKPKEIYNDRSTPVCAFLQLQYGRS